MKKIYSVLSVLLTIILMGVFVSCERDKEVMLTAVSVTNEQITPTYKSATISSTISSEATIRDVFVQYTVTKDFAEYDEVPMQEKDGIYTAELIDLLDNTTYYYRYAASNRHSAIVLQKIQQFATLQPTVPAIRLDSILTVWDSYAQVQVALEFDGGTSVTDMGVCWGTQANPTIEDIHKSTKDTVAVLDMTDLQPNTKYYIRAYAMNKVGVAYSEEKEFTTSIKPKYVDLGLPSGVKWATFNVGANSPEESGDYYAWGETSPKSSYTWLNYKWCEGSYNMLTKYNCDSSKGVVDYKTILDPEDDAATVNWGQGWRIPTKAEFDELIDNCTWTWSSINGVYGYEVKSNTNGNSIFLPSVGYYSDNTFQTYSSRYRSSSLGVNTTPYFLNFNASYIQIIFQGNKSDGYAIRPVSGDYAPDVPTVITYNVIEITNTSVSVVCEIIRDGGLPIIECGVSYVEGTTTPIELERKIMAENNSTEYICHITGLKANTSYRVRAYAVNSKGTAYGSPVTFTTKEQSSTPNNGTENGYAYVDLGLSVKWATCNVGANNPEDYGDYFAWGETTTKDTYNWSTYKYCNGSDDSLTKYCDKSSYGNNGFTDNKTQLELSDDAARANWGGSWRMPSNEERNELIDNCTWEWTTQNGVNGYKVTSKSNGNSIFLPAAGYRYDSSLISAGSRGLYWSSSLGTDYPYYAWGVYFNSGYVYRDYGSRSYGHSVRPVLGENKGTETTVPTVTTAAITQITETTAVAGGNVTSDGNASVTERGVVYSTEQNPTTDDNKLTSGSGTGEFTCNLTDLQPNTIYYVRAYATNEKGTAYGEELNFTTSKQIVLPTVTTNAVTQITETTAVAGGNVTNDGGISVTERGVVYSLSAHPFISDLSSTIVRSGSGTGAFTCNLSNLQAGTTYYVRAYAINNKGTAYGDEVSFTTALPISLATVTTASITNITETTAKAGGTVTNDGNASVTERGVCIATVSNPTTSNTKITAGSGTGSFTCNLTGLQANTTYYVRAYAVNSKGTAYGEQVSFTTQQQSNTPPTDDAIIFDADIDQGNASTDTNNAAAYQITKSGVTMEVSSGVIGIYNNEAHYRIFKSQTLTLTSTVGNIVKVEFTCTATDDTKYGPGCFTVDGGEYAYSGAVGTWTGAADAITFTASTNQVRATQVAVTIIDNGTENGTENGYAYVDLGLSVKWATMNVGANKPEDYGDYFAWGETQPKSTYNWSTYKYCNGSSSTLTKYNTNSSYGTVDNKTTLDLNDDAANANWGGSWRMPTDAEWTELCEQCTWTWTTQNGVYGIKVTSKTNGNSIFLPAAGYRGYSSLYDAGSRSLYWSSSLGTGNPLDACYVGFYSSNVYRSSLSRYYGQSVRPVCP